MLRNNTFGITLFLTLMVGLGMTGNALAQTCKGMEKTACESTDGCYWVDAYKRKDGVEVSGHCRGKAGGKKADGDKKGKDNKGKQEKAE